jgi:hypothetical protein
MLKFCVRFAAALALGCLAPALAQTQEAVSVAVAPPNTAGSPSTQPACNCVVIPALTPVSLEIAASVGSKISKTGDTFPIRLAAPIILAGRQVLPAGATGVGEVVHAKKSGGMGAAGELVLAARYLDVGGARMHLRSMHLAVAGKSNIDRVNALNAASVASPVPIGLIGFFIGGGQILIAAGTPATAKVAEAFTLEPAEQALPATASQVQLSAPGETKQ